jgi:spore maturation protein CgeB
MKTLKSVVLASAVFFITAASAQRAEETATGLTFKEDTHNFGDIPKDKPASYDFAFTNTSNKDITITDVKASCGCTVPSYPKTAIKPGESAVITAVYNPHYTGSFSKTLTVKTDADEKTVLHVKGKVVKAATEN